MELPVLEGGVERDRPEEEDLKKGNHKKSENIDEQQLFNIDPDLDQHQGLSTSNRIDPLVILTSVTDGSDIITDRNQMLHYQSSNQQQEKQPASSATQESPPLPQPEQSSPSLSSSSSYAPSSLSDPSRLIKSLNTNDDNRMMFEKVPKRSITQVEALNSSQSIGQNDTQVYLKPSINPALIDNYTEPQTHSEPIISQSIQHNISDDANGCTTDQSSNNNHIDDHNDTQVYSNPSINPALIDSHTEPQNHSEPIISQQIQHNSISDCTTGKTTNQSISNNHNNGHKDSQDYSTPSINPALIDSHTEPQNHSEPIISQPIQHNSISDDTNGNTTNQNNNNNHLDDNNDTQVYSTLNVKRALIDSHSEPQPHTEPITCGPIQHNISDVTNGSTTNQNSNNNHSDDHNDTKVYLNPSINPALIDNFTRTHSEPIISQSIQHKISDDANGNTASQSINNDHSSCINLDPIELQSDRGVSLEDFKLQASNSRSSPNQLEKEYSLGSHNLSSGSIPTAYLNSTPSSELPPSYSQSIQADHPFSYPKNSTKLKSPIGSCAQSANPISIDLTQDSDQESGLIVSSSSSSSSKSSSSSIIITSPAPHRVQGSSNPISSNPKFRHLPSNQLLALRQNVALRQAEQLQHHHDQKPSNPLQCGPSLSSTNSMAMAFNTSPYNQTLVSMPPPSSAPSSSRVHLPPPHPADLYQSFPISHTPRSIYPSQSPWRSNYLLQPTPYAHDCSSTSTIHDEIPLCIGLLSSSVFILYPIKNLDPPGFGPDSQARAQTLPVLISRGQPNASQEMLKVISASNGEPLGLVDYKMANVIGPLLGPYNSISGTNPVGGWKPQLNGVSRGDNNGYTDEDVDDDIEIEEIDGVTGQTINRKTPSQPQSDGRRLYIECCVIRRGEVDPMMLPLQFLVFCLPSNVQLFGSYLARSGIVLEHPISYEPSLHLGCQYANPHRAHSGESWENARQRLIRSGSTFPQNTISLEPGNSQTKTYDAHEQVEAVFKNLASGVDLDETEPSELVVTPLYPHQKQALSFMLDRERLKDVEETKETVSGPVELAKLELEDEVNLVSLWKKNRDSRGKHIGWINVVTGTQQNCTQSPEQCRGSLLADDMGLGKTISVISLIATTLSEALEFSFSDVVKPAVVTQTTVKNALASDKSKKLTDHASTLLERLGHLSGGDTLSASHAKLKKDDQAAAKKQSAVDSRFKMVKVKSRATLIVSPLSTIQNWESQIEEHVRRRCGIDSKDLIDGSNSRSALSVYVYHGNQRNPDPEFLADHDIVITTYSLMGYEFARQNRNNKVEEDNHDSSDGIEEIDSKGNPLSSDAGRDRNKAQAKRKRKGDGLPSPLQAVQWFRIVLDEAHMIKEHTTIQAKAACDLLAERRVCLTGTPLQNSLNDLFSLVCFLRLEPFTDRSLWTAYVGTPAKMGNRLGVTRLHLIMRHLALRRTKQTVDKFGKPILSLPHKKNDIVYLDFDDSEKEFYLAYHQQSRKTFLTMEKSQTVLKNYCSILQEILRLRQICTHIGLVVDAEKKAGKSAYDVLALADNQAKFDKTRAIQLLMILRDTGATQCSECGVDAIPVSNEEDLDEFEDYIPTTNKRGRKSNGTSAGKRKGKALGSSLANDSDSPTIVITRCQHLFCLKCFNYSSEVTCQVDCLVCSQKLSPLVDVYKATIAELDKSIRLEEMGAQNRLAPESITEDRMSKAKKSNSGKAVNPASSSTSANHGKEKSTNSFDTMHLEHSTKIKHLIWDLLPFSRANPSSSNFSPNFTTFGNGLDGLGDDEEEPPEFRPTVGTVVKSVVFSQWTKLLDKISDALTEYKIEHVRLDGTMNREERSDSMSAFKIHPRFEVLLVSLRAGGVGLNLTCAQRVYLMEPFWNPAVENQAVDRVHRLGQTKPVRMIRYIISGSIEQNLLEIQKRKTELANMSLGQTLSKAELAKRRLEDLSILFRDNMKR